jgi:hypothetical protein
MSSAPSMLLLRRQQRWPNCSPVRVILVVGAGCGVTAA